MSSPGTGGPSGVARGYLLVAAMGIAALCSTHPRLGTHGWRQIWHTMRHGGWRDLFGDLLPDRIHEHKQSSKTETVDREGLSPPDTASSQRTPSDNPYLLDPHRRLDTFFAALTERETGRREKVRILFFGTSEIGHDRVTSQLRRQLQERFGDGGKGWVLVNRTWSILDHRDIRWRHDTKNWRSFSIRTAKIPDGRYGLGGVLVKSVNPAWVEYRTAEIDSDADADAGYHAFPSGNAWSKIELHYQRHPQGGAFQVTVDNEPPATVTTSGEVVQDGIFRRELIDGPHTLRIDASPNVQLYGAVFERGPGVVLDALMVIGAFGHSLAAYDPEHLREQIDHRDPSLLIFQYGAKEALLKPVLSPAEVQEFISRYQDSVRQVMDGRPTTACLIISPNDQGWLQGGRVETRPAIPLLVEAAQQVAAANGCAFYNLFEAVGGAGSARRWAYQQPRLVSADYGHLLEPGSIYVGDLLSDLLLGEYEAYAAWIAQRNKSLEDLDVDGLPAPTKVEHEAFAAVRDDTELFETKTCTQAGRAAIDCRDPRSYISTNERGQPLWAPYLQDRGGGYAGLGADQNYNFIAEARSHWAWLFDYDPTVVDLHRIVGVLVRDRETPKAFVQAFAPAQRALTRQLLAAAWENADIGPAERTAVLGVFDDIAPELFDHFRRSQRERPLFPNWGWLHVPEKYQYIRTLMLQGRVRVVKANLLSDVGLRSIGDSARALGVPIRVLYLSNADTHWARLTQAYRNNMMALPFDQRSVVMRTVPGKRWNREQGFSKWHYLLHHGPSFQQQISQREVRRWEDLLRQRIPLAPLLSWCGPQETTPTVETGESERGDL